MSNDTDASAGCLSIILIVIIFFWGGCQVYNKQHCKSSCIEQHQVCADVDWSGDFVCGDPNRFVIRR